MFNHYIVLSMLLILPGLSHPLWDSNNILDARDSRAPFLSAARTIPSASTDDLDCSCQSMPETTIPAVPDRLSDQYSVILNTSIDFGSHIKALEDFISTNENCANINNTIDIQIDNPLFFKYYSGQFDGHVLAFISSSAGVTRIERIQSEIIPNDDASLPAQNASEARSIEARRAGATWGLARITQDTPVVTRPLLRTGKWQGTSATSRDWVYAIKDGADGQNVAIYVVDSGVNPHSEFGGRVEAVSKDYSNIKYGSANQDLFGHGTAVASVAAGATVGVASEASIIPIRISSGAAISTTAQIVDGIYNALNHYVIERGRKGGAVINLSNYLKKHVDIQDAITSAVEAGMHVVVAAGNDNQDRCSQLSYTGATVVGAINIKNQKSDFSNFGQCVDVFAPGEDIIVADAKQPAGYIIKSGSSIAAPMVSGMIATIIGQSPS
ncbi:peptidase S8/S53 domain-containing protein [Mycena galericulata]|nr:peptidase S8/S53 domain-containing protein [Mycena galericulata]